MGGSVQAWREANGDINLMELTARSAEDEATPPATTESPWLFTAPEIVLESLVVQVEDRQASPPSS